MSFEVMCRCRQTLIVEDTLVGQVVQCPVCNRHLKIPAGFTPGGDPLEYLEHDPLAPKEFSHIPVHDDSDNWRKAVNWEYTRPYFQLTALAVGAIFALALVASVAIVLFRRFVH